LIVRTQGTKGWSSTKTGPGARPGRRSGKANTVDTGAAAGAKFAAGPSQHRRVDTRVQRRSGRRGLHCPHWKRAARTATVSLWAGADGTRLGIGESCGRRHLSVLRILFSFRLARPQAIRDLDRCLPRRKKFPPTRGHGQQARNKAKCRGVSTASRITRERPTGHIFYTDPEGHAIYSGRPFDHA